MAVGERIFDRRRRSILAPGSRADSGGARLRDRRSWQRRRCARVEPSVALTCSSSTSTSASPTSTALDLVTQLRASLTTPILVPPPAPTASGRDPHGGGGTHGPPETPGEKGKVFSTIIIDVTVDPPGADPARAGLSSQDRERSSHPRPRPPVTVPLWPLLAYRPLPLASDSDQAVRRRAMMDPGEAQ